MSAWNHTWKHKYGSENPQDCSNSFRPTLRSQPHDNSNKSINIMLQKGDSGYGLSRVNPKFDRGRKIGRATKGQSCSVGVVVVLFFGLMGLTLLGNHYHEKGSTEIIPQSDERKSGHISVHGGGNWDSKVLGFGQGSMGSGQDSRYWDRDDRRRDDDRRGDVSAAFFKSRNIDQGDDEDDKLEKSFYGDRNSGVDKDHMDKNEVATHFADWDKHNSSAGKPKKQDFGNGSLYNEHGRDELKIYEKRYEADVKEHGLRDTANGDGLLNVGYDSNIREDIAKNSSSSADGTSNFSQIQKFKHVAMEDDYDERIDYDDINEESNASDTSHQHPYFPGMQKHHDEEYERKHLIVSQRHEEKQFDGKQKNHSENVLRKYFSQESTLRNNNNFSEVQSNLPSENSHIGKSKEKLESKFISDVDQEQSQNFFGIDKRPNISEDSSWHMNAQKRNTNSSRSKRRKHPNIPCEIAFLNSTDRLQEPEENPNFAKFSLGYVQREEKSDGVDVWEPRFAGHQTLEERGKSFYARDQKLLCGFVKGPEGSLSTGFDLYEDDAEFLSTCHIAVSSCIFGNFDNIRTPTKKKVSQISQENVCFVMFVDEKTLEMLSSEGRLLDENGHIGLWKIVVVRNLPYVDMRRTGKIPKFLSHRLFPSARYSIWIDSKMRLHGDPLLILEYFLWRNGFEYAISNHYDRHCVWEEVIQNKRLNKFNHTVIDEQFAVYQADGLTKFNASDPNKLLPSYVPEGSFIVRAHTPMSNQFSCLWFNEVDRFTPRDQLSFAYTFLKFKRMNREMNFRLNMFKDCERRFISKLFHHKAEETLRHMKG